MSGTLTAEQLRRIEENKQRARAKLAEKNKTAKGHQPSGGFIPKSTGGPVKSNSTNFSSSGSWLAPSNTYKTYHSQVSDSSSARSSVVKPTTLPVTCKPDAKLTSCSQNTRQSVAQSIDIGKGKLTLDVDRIEQNRLKALAKRAEILSKSPVKQRNQTVASSSHGQWEQTGPQSTICSTKSSSVFHDVHTNRNNVSNPFKASNIQQNRQVIGTTNTPFNSSNMLSIESKLQKDYASTSVHSSSVQTSNQSQRTSTVTQQPNQQNRMTQQNGPNIFSNFTGPVVKGYCVLISKDRFGVKSGYSAPLVQLFKTMNTKLYDAVTKKWSLNLSEYNRFISAVVSLKSAVEVEQLPKAILTTFSDQIRGVPTRNVPIADLTRVEPSLVTSLMSFQREGVNFGVYKNGRVLIGDDMGLGKTIQAICLSRYYKSEWPLLVVVPSSVRFDWSQQFQRWIPSLDPQSVNVVVTGKDDCTSGLINILSYDLMARKAEVLKKKRFQVIIMDECHLLKNHKTVRCKAALPLLQAAKRVFLLSGTPALSRPSELYTQITAVCPYLFKFHDFGVRYCDGRQMTWGWDYTGSSNMEELQILLAEKIMIRRLKKDVLTELPDKIRQMILLDPSSIKISKDLKSASKVMSSANLKKKDEQGALLDFFHKSGAAKSKAIKLYVEDLLEGEKKFLIFGHHGDILDVIEDTVKTKIGDKYIRIDGRTGSEQRNFFCKKFQFNDEIRVAILSITAANAGLNLSSANLVVFAELFWNPGILVQAEDRAHRIGQQDIVVVQYLVATGTSDDHIWPMIQRKLDVLSQAGLTKDNFSSAETTRLTDQRQEEITKFLDESFHIDTSMVANDDEGMGPTRSPSKVMKQKSILQYTSPMKECTSLSRTTSPSKTKLKQTTLFNSFGNQPKHCNQNDRRSFKTSTIQSNSERPSDAKTDCSSNNLQSDRSEVQGHKTVQKGHLEGEGCFEGDDNDLEAFLKDDDWDIVEEPAMKKMKL